MSKKSLNPSVLLVEDEESIAAIIKYNLQKNNFSVQVASDGAAAMNIIQESQPDIIILDWMLPSISGIDICKNIRNNTDIANIPIIILSAKGEEHSRVKGLDAGADDYITKPFSPTELIARINSVLRRLRPAFTNKVLEYSDIVMDLTNITVVRDGIEIKLAPIEFRILQIMMENPSRVFSREALIDKIWGGDVYVGTRTVDVHITRLRKALTKASSNGIDIIQTIRLAGYTLREVHNKK